MLQPVINSDGNFSWQWGEYSFFILHFHPVIGIKRRARLIKKSARQITVSPLPAGLSSEFNGFGLSRVETACVEVIRDNEALFSTESDASFDRAFIPRNLHFKSANLPMLYPFRRFSGLQGR
ncbi:hypothetical protein [Enterobacter sp. Bisph1]|uniref:hypothetical protein n=1 Tax=Enterobacter sp. Bisph1 TaxID=1274399 RepID=UPI0012E0A7E5|nr:hypothetical protein [Enterobacter sp. Bisph1]